MYAQQTGKIQGVLFVICPKESEAGKFDTEAVFRGLKLRVW
jgi:hypothetical protein